MRDHENQEFWPLYSYFLSQILEFLVIDVPGSLIQEEKIAFAELIEDLYLNKKTRVNNDIYFKYDRCMRFLLHEFSQKEEGKSNPDYMKHLTNYSKIYLIQILSVTNKREFVVADDRMQLYREEFKPHMISFFELIKSNVEKDYQEMDLCFKNILMKGGENNELLRAYIGFLIFKYKKLRKGLSFLLKIFTIEILGVETKYEFSMEEFSKISECLITIYSHPFLLGAVENIPKSPHNLVCFFEKKIKIIEEGKEEEVTLKNPTGVYFLTKIQEHVEKFKASLVKLSVISWENNCFLIDLLSFKRRFITDVGKKKSKKEIIESLANVLSVSKHEELIVDLGNLSTMKTLIYLTHTNIPKSYDFSNISDCFYEIFFNSFLETAQKIQNCCLDILKIFSQEYLSSMIRDFEHFNKKNLYEPKYLSPSQNYNVIHNILIDESMKYGVKSCMEKIKILKRILGFSLRFKRFVNVIPNKDAFKNKDEIEKFFNDHLKNVLVNFVEKDPETMNSREYCSLVLHNSCLTLYLNRCNYNEDYWFALKKKLIQNSTKFFETVVNYCQNKKLSFDVCLTKKQKTVKDVEKFIEI